MNPTDPAVNNQVTEHLAAKWAPQGRFVFVRYLADDNFPHDIIDPNGSEARIAETHPIVLDLLTRGQDRDHPGRTSRIAGPIP